MKGFGLDSSKQQVLKAIEEQDEKKLGQRLERLANKYGGEKVTNWFMQEVMPLVEAESIPWVLIKICGKEKYEKSRELVSKGMVEILEEKGFELGKDFSRHEEDGFYLTEEASEALLEIVPEEDREEIRKEIIKTEEVEDAQTALEKHLGVPFVENIWNRLETRLPEVTDEVAGYYLLCIGCGVHDRTGLEVFPILIENLKEKYPKRANRIWKAILAIEANGVKTKVKEEAMPKVLLDLVIAAGGESTIMRHPEKSDEYLISVQGMRLLASVYQGENSIYELVGAMDAHERKLKENRNKNESS